MWSSRIEGPGLDMWRLWKTRKTREKEKVFLDIFLASLLDILEKVFLDILLDINNITGFSPHLEIESFGLPWSPWTMVMVHL